MKVETIINTSYERYKTRQPTEFDEHAINLQLLPKI